ncbi:glycosyltransferase family 39 protein [Candidatus Woesebacteria bacterium]|nr:glycosyltransferase family 39 protein [Candidatus Woesebacteria bacterium]
MKQVIKKIAGLTKKQWFLVSLIVIAFFTRFYNLEDTVQFLGDQGRDAFLVSRIFTDADPVFIGPVTSVGNMYLGPLYYYFMLPFLWLSYPSPMGPVYAVAGLGVLTVYLMYKLGREMLGEKTALVATALYTICTTVIVYTRFSWNPNPAPLLSLIMMWAIYRAIKKNPWYWVVVTSMFAALIQLHYITLLSGVSFGLFWMYHLFSLLRSKSKKRNIQLRLFGLATMVSAILGVASTIPLMLFDWKHDWLNVKAFENLLFGEDNFKVATHQGNRALRAVKESQGRAMHMLFEITIGKIRNLNEFMLLVVLGGVGYVASQWKKREHAFGEVIITVFMVVAVLGTAVYEHSVYDHYVAYIFPVTFFIIGMLLVEAWKKGIIGKVAAVGFVGYYTFFNLSTLQLGDTGWKLSDIKRTSDAIAERVRPGEKYNIVLLSETGDIDGQNYRYFLSTTETSPDMTEERGSVETLFIINEDRALEKVTDSPVYEIVVFPDKEPKEVFEIPGGPEITMLRKSNDTPEVPNE